jgi:hypothetical protein
VSGLSVVGENAIDAQPLAANHARPTTADERRAGFNPPSGLTNVIRIAEKPAG